MKKNTQRHLIMASLFVFLLLPAIFCLLNHYTWQPVTLPNDTQYLLYLVTQSAGRPYVIFSILTFLTITLYHYRDIPLKQKLILLILITSTFLAGEASKSIIKNTRKEARPYVVWLADNHYIPSPQYFYDLPRKQRAQLINTQQPKLNQQHIPQWLQNHWQAETGYSFPSGHTIFAALLAMIMAVILWHKKAYFTIILSSLWAVTVIISRILLGMHWAIDTLAACIIAFILTHIFSRLFDKWLKMQEKVK